ncbi:hypothetical protein V6Z11_D06G230600 [Gossypium hirsutum]
MELKWLAMVLVLLSLGAGLCDGCLEEERFALFQLKPFFEVIDYKFQDLDYESKPEKESSSNCCEWIRVECNPISGRVTHLFLDYSSYMKIDWYLNASLFLPFEKLQSLSLRGNFITGCIANQGFERLPSKLDKLENLDLSDNHFNNSILASLSELSSLKSLNLTENVFTRSNPTNGIEMLSKLNNLETLDLSGNRLGNNILSQLDGFASLKSLRLEYCGLEGTLDIQGMVKQHLVFEFKSNNNWMNLKELYLEGNEIESLGSLFHGKEGMKLNKLEVLSLRLNFLNNSVFSSLVELSNLKSLDLFFNKLEGAIYTKDLNALSNLEELILSDNFQLNGLIPSQGNDCGFSLQSLGLFPTLKTLSLGGFNINETTMASYSHNTDFTSLKRLELWDCKINKNLTQQEGLNLRSLEELELSYSSLPSNFIQVFGPLISLKKLTVSGIDGNNRPPMHGVCEFTNLQELDMYGCNLKGSLPMCFSNLTSLKILTLLESLDLSSNQFSGNISALESLTSLQSLDVSNNKFHIPSSLRPLFNLSKLKYLHADNNTIHADDHEMSHSSAPRFQLSFISLSCCGSVGELQYVDLSNTYFKVDRFPFWLLDNNTMLGTLYLVNCSLSGPFQVPSHVHSALSYLDISNNAFGGNIPVRIGAHLPFLAYLNMSKNCFNGSIPSSFGDMSSLHLLNLSNNQLSGEIPEHMAMGCSSLEFLALSNNKLQGTIFSGNFNLTSLLELELNGNNFTGMIPNVLANCSDLYILDLSNNYIYGELAALDVSRNQLFGRLPQWRGSASNLEQVAMADNQLEGSIPRAICSLNLKLQFLDLSMNSLSGTLPSCFKPVLLQGALPNAFHDSSWLGNIPNWVSNLSELSYLLLRRNHFEGEIPIQLCKLDRLSLIDLSQNNLSGGIPYCLKVSALNYVTEQYILHRISIEYTVKSRSYNYKRRMLQYMSGIDLSCNKLTGEISFETKNIMKLFTLNLSHNSLTGPVPRAFSNLKDMESLDLSYNNLTGNIPAEFAVLHFLEYFNVSYNNLSGKTPERIGQLGAFDESNYVGNPFLCGSLVGKNCSPVTTPLTPKASSGITEDHGFIDMDAFYASFFACYMMVLLCIAAVLYINPYWRQAWFYYIQMAADSCYYFVVDNFPRNFCTGNM